MAKIMAALRRRISSNERAGWIGLSHAYCLRWPSDLAIISKVSTSWTAPDRVT